MDAFTGYRLVERVLAHGETKSSVLLSRRLPGRPPAGAEREPRRGAAVLHRLEGAQHRAARPGAAARLQAERIRAVPARRRRRGGRRGRRRDLRALGLAPIPPELRENRGEIEAAEARRAARAGHAEPICAAISTCTRPPPTAGPTSRRWRRRRGSWAPATSPSPITARRWRWPTVSTSARALAHAARDSRAQRAARRHHPARRDRVRHPRRTARMDLADDCLAQLDIVDRLGPLGVQPGARADDRSAPARARLPVGRHPRAPDRPAAPQREGYRYDMDRVFAPRPATGVAIEINSQVDRLDLERHAGAAGARARRCSSSSTPTRTAPPPSRTFAGAWPSPAAPG